MLDFFNLSKNKKRLMMHRCGKKQDNDVYDYGGDLSLKAGIRITIITGSRMLGSQNLRSRRTEIHNVYLYV